jgi:hypothetical protein
VWALAAVEAGLTGGPEAGVTVAPSAEGVSLQLRF